jgi:hypothetical protein
VEVYDVLIKARHKRLQMFHLRSGQDLLTVPDQSDYLERMEKLFKQGSGEEESVYVLEVDKSLYDVREEGFTQVHCLRFEIERGSTFKLTDIDYFLEGSRHARAHSEELFNDAK